MNLRDVSALIVRIFALWLALSAFAGFWSSMGMFGQSGSAWRSIVAWSVGSSTFLGGVAWALWANATRVGTLLVPRHLRDAPPVPFSYANLERLVFSAVGLLILGNAAPSLVHWGFYLTAYSPTRGEPEGLSASQIADLASSVTRIAIGLFLFLGADVVQRLVVRLRGLPRHP